jgi:hypothetical protein
MTTFKHAAAGAAKGTGVTALTLVFAALFAVGVPLFWVFVASKLAGNDPDINTALALLITVGILVTYWLAMLAALAIRSRFVTEDEDLRKVRRMSWNRSFRDEPYHPGEHKSDPVERLFVLTAVLGFIAFEVWFFFFAGSPLPSQPAF